MEPLGLYIHIPFCVRKCRYCDFLSAPANEDTKRRYAHALSREIRLRGWQMQGSAGQKHPVDTIFFGGGTPTAMPADCLSSILNTIRESFDVLLGAEITCEMNPGTFLPSAAEAVRDNGLDSGLLRFLTEEVNRVSIGLQSVHDRELATLGRIHTFRDFLFCFASLRAAGARNISVDLMSGLPGQTAESFSECLRTVANLGPEHISAYGLILEEGTPFFEMEEKGLFKGSLALPGEEEEREMYRAAKQILAEYGYQRYEISNYARPGFASRHNLRYWQRRPYLGFGIGAASFQNHRRWRNTRSLARYLDLLESDMPALRPEGATRPHLSQGLERAGEAQVLQGLEREGDVRLLDSLEREVETLSLRSEMEEFMFLGLRMSRGVSEAAFAACFGRTISEVYGEVLQKLLREGLLLYRREDGTGWYALTERGIDISNRVLAEFL